MRGDILSIPFPSIRGMLFCRPILPSFLLLLLLLVAALNCPLVQCSKFYDKYTKGNVPVRLDRNSKEMSAGNMFNIRYQLLDVFYTVPNEGPILVGICGQFWLEKCMNRMQDLLEDIAPRLNAAILFIEHRFYGLSYQGYQPTSPDTSAYNNLDKLTHLRVEEVLEDIREVINGVAGIGTNPMQRTVLIGEDYAAALALWMNMQALKNPKKERPKFVWAASPSPLALSADAPLSTKFDNQMAVVLKQFGCLPTLIQPIFQFMDQTAKPGSAQGLETVRTALCYDGQDDLATMKDNVVEVLRMTMAKNVPRVDEKNKKYIWPLEVLCDGLKKAPNASEKAHAFGTFMNSLHGSTGLTRLKYQKVIDNGMNDNELHAMNFQRCTELATDNCAAGGNNDPFYGQCQAQAGQNYIKTKCKSKWLSTLVGYNPDGANSLYQPNFIKTKFGFDFTKMANVLISGNQYDQFAQTFKFPASDPKRNFVAFPSVGLSVRGRELSAPSTCDPMSLSELRTQVVDILLCLFHGHSTACVQQKKWPAALSPESRADDAKRHVKACKSLLWQYPWASYPHPGPPKPPPPKPRNGAALPVAGLLLILYTAAAILLAILLQF